MEFRQQAFMLVYKGKGVWEHFHAFKCDITCDFKLIEKQINLILSKDLRIVTSKWKNRRHSPRQLEIFFFFFSIYLISTQHENR